MMSTVGICPKILCWLRDAKRLIVYVLKVYEIVPLQKCRDAGMKPLDLICVDRQACGSDTQGNSIEVVCKRIQNEEAR